jgi:prepilin-type N-terminal cleavage/methylation domain-containing protein
MRSRVRLELQQPEERRARVNGFTLVESLVAMLILGIMVAGVVSGFMQCHRTAEWSAYSLAAQSLAMQPIEQARAAKWDPYKAVPVDELVASNFPTTTHVLDVPLSKNGMVLLATNRVRISNVSVNPPLRAIHVECTWSFPRRGVFTNSMLVYRASDQ